MYKFFVVFFFDNVFRLINWATVIAAATTLCCFFLPLGSKESNFEVLYHFTNPATHDIRARSTQKISSKLLSVSLVIEVFNSLNARYFNIEPVFNWTHFSARSESIQNAPLRAFLKVGLTSTFPRRLRAPAIIKSLESFSQAFHSGNCKSFLMRTLFQKLQPLRCARKNRPSGKPALKS